MGLDAWIKTDDDDDDNEFDAYVTQCRSQKVWLGRSPFSPFLPLPLLSFLPSLPPFPLPLEVGPILRLGVWGALKRF